MGDKWYLLKNAANGVSVLRRLKSADYKKRKNTFQRVNADGLYVVR